MNYHELSWTIMNHPSSYHSYESKNKWTLGWPNGPWILKTFPPKNAQKHDKAFQTTFLQESYHDLFTLEINSCHSIEESSQISPTKVIQQLYWDVLDKKRLGFDGSARESNQDPVKQDKNQTHTIDVWYIYLLHYIHKKNIQPFMYLDISNIYRPIYIYIYIYRFPWHAVLVFHEVVATIKCLIGKPILRA